MSTPETAVSSAPEATPKSTAEADTSKATPTVVDAAADSVPAAAAAVETPAAQSPVIDTPAPVATPASSAATPASPEATPTPVTEPAREREMVADARLAVLRGMFPDFDDSLLQSVLGSVGGDTDRAIDALLGMSDPDFKSEQSAAQQQAPQTQEELDEQLARTLMLEDEQQAHAWQAQQQQPPPDMRRRTSDGPPEKDTMQEFQEQFNKFAESGKKTFGTLFSKVKAKIQEFDQPAGQSSSSQYGAGAGGDTYPYEANQHPYPAARRTPQQQQQAQQQAQMPAYYDPNAPASNTTPPSSATAMGYDAAPRSMSPSDASGPASPPTTNAGAPQIDGGKLGMLPKRPVSLLRTNSPPTTAPPRSDEDELEYAENPFEEPKVGAK
ncbi:hypothetical protein C8R43DRAFT_1033780 [Mycena crocata]|nr:hypothetical protein C8R43DRAFT_1033780 [Mycena crocata]